MKKLSQIELKKLFTSPKALHLKKEMCKIGWLLWQRGLIDGNGGNIVVKLASGLYLCTPTMISKGCLTTSDICLVDSTGMQLFGKRNRTSEVMTHLAILNGHSKIIASIHSHPPIATAFAV